MPTRYVAHRGGAAQWPENSLTAFRNAIALGARVLELDVHQTADGAIAVIHDPTLDEVLALAAPAGVAMLVEIKTPGQDVRYERRGEQAVAVPGPRYDGLERKVLDALRGAGMSERAYVMAFNPAILAEVRVLAPAQATTLLVDRRHVEDSGARPVDTVAWAIEARASFVGMHYSLCDASVVEAAHRAKIAVGVFTVNDEATMRRLAGFGVDVIISDRADLVTRLQAEE